MKVQPVLEMHTIFIFLYIEWGDSLPKKNHKKHLKKCFFFFFIRKLYPFLERLILKGSQNTQELAFKSFFLSNKYKIPKSILLCFNFYWEFFEYSSFFIYCSRLILGKATCNLLTETKIIFHYYFQITWIKQLKILSRAMVMRLNKPCSKLCNSILKIFKTGN